MLVLGGPCGCWRGARRAGTGGRPRASGNRHSRRHAAGRPPPIPHARFRPPSSPPPSERRNVVVYLRNARPQHVSPMRAVIRQHDETFTPRVVAVTVGSEVDFPNDDPIYHNVFSLSRAKNFNLGRYPRGETRRVRFDKPGVVKVFCEIHSHMSATVMVFDHPWFAVPDEAGRFQLPPVPPGDHQITAWHERLGDTTVNVRLEAGGAPRNRLHAACPRKVRRPPRLVARTLAVAFVTVAVILSIVFIVLMVDSRDRVRAAEIEKLSVAERVFTSLEKRRQQEQLAAITTLAENPTLKAALDTYFTESRFAGLSDDQEVSLRATVALEAEKLATLTRADVLAILDPAGRVFVSAGPARDRGRSTIRSPPAADR